MQIDDRPCDLQRGRVPAVSLPLFQGDEGLPLTVQLIGRPVGEDALLALAAQVEAALPWAGRLPAAALA